MLDSKLCVPRKGVSATSYALFVDNIMFPCVFELRPVLFIDFFITNECTDLVISDNIIDGIKNRITSKVEHPH